MTRYEFLWTVVLAPITAMFGVRQEQESTITVSEDQDLTVQTSPSWSGTHMWVDSASGDLTITADNADRANIHIDANGLRMDGNMQFTSTM